MQVTITENEKKNAIELLFGENLPKEFSTFLLELGFREVLKKKNTWYADAHPAYKSFATSLVGSFSISVISSTLKRFIICPLSYIMRAFRL